LLLGNIVTYYYFNLLSDNFEQFAKVY
jgi:hypothetical protein